MFLPHGHTGPPIWSIFLTRRDSALPDPAPPQAALDETDLRILACLAEDARLSQRALAREIGMSQPAISERIARLEEMGVIRGYRALLDFGALGWPNSVFVGIQTDQGGEQRRLAKELLAMPEVESVDLVMGPVDLMVRLRVRDQEHLRRFFFDLLPPLKGIHRTESYMSLETFEQPNFTKGLLERIGRPLARFSARRNEQPARRRQS
jgi:Lrp/AsnC family transcriptional regulator, leucine-responsive regulatory protein